MKTPATDAVELRATYRLQLRNGVGFREAAALVPYLKDLGVSHVYTSPYLLARAGSTHGYDVVDHGVIDPAIGTEADFDAFIETLARYGMGHLLDWVPNHVGVGPDNPRWQSVLELGRDSPDADFFDIEWETSRPALDGKVLLPVLGADYGTGLEAGELYVVFDAASGAFAVGYHEHRFPVSLATAARLIHAAAEGLPDGDTHDAHDALIALAREFGDLGRRRVANHRRRAFGAAVAEMKRRLARLVASHPVVCDAVERVAASLGGNPGEPASFTPLHRLLEAQHYRLAYWRVAADEINYRRFFDISELAALRMEREEVFEATHERVLDWVRRGCIDGLRIDHVDGLADPRAYLERLRAHFPDAQRYLFVEKILGDGETLRDWPVDGTTGYEFLNLVNGLFVDTRGRGKFERLHRHVTGDARSFDEILSASKRHVIRTLLASEIEVLAGGLERLAERDWHTRDFTLSEIRRALEDLVVCFPVYRSYVDARGAGPQDRRIIGEAVGAARALSGDPESDLFVWLERVLAADLVAPAPPSARRRELLRLVCRFQQYTAPVMAKGFEDTALYREHVLLSLNEVGGDPRRFGVSVDAFHEANRERARRWPRSLLTTSTHDTKRGEDVRARLDVLSEIPDHWRDQVRRWMRLNRGLRRRVAGELVPHPKDEYLLYQTLLGSWPASELGGVVGVQADYLERIGVYLVKAMREGKERTSWRHARQDYERAVLDFAGRILAPASAFLGEFRRFQAEVAQAGALTSLAQLVLKLTVPGVPDIYQGCELWDLSLADPDNRRGVDFAKRRSWLTEVEALDPAQPGILEGLLSHWHDGRIKLFVTRRLLALRSRHPGLFARGEYVSLEPRGKAESRVCAFARRGDDEPTLLVVVARLCAELARPGGVLFPAPDEWADTALTAPDGGPWRDVLTGSRLDEGGRVLTVARLFQRLPFAVLIAEP